METKAKTYRQLEEIIRRIIRKYPPLDEPTLYTNIRLQVSQNSGEIIALDDEDSEILREQPQDWLSSDDADSENDIAFALQNVVEKLHQEIDKMGINKPFSFVYEDENHTPIAELYTSRDQNDNINGDLMKNLDKDLDSFFDDLMKE